jgi:hypothetical protein
MKKLTSLILILLCTFSLHSQNLIGAWRASTLDKKGDLLTNVVIFSEGYQVSTWFDATTGKFVSTNGGAWSLQGNTITETIEFDTENPDRVGTQVSFEIKYTNKRLEIVGDERIWERIDNGIPGKLQGAWLMSGRVRDGKTQKRDTNRPRTVPAAGRITMKILSGTRFQWIAYNTETKEFKGTGGGTYTTVDGKYTENIEFFSRDNSRVGASLQFDYEFVDGAWHHKGFSSKGAAMHEIWSVRN